MTRLSSLTPAQRHAILDANPHLVADVSEATGAKLTTVSKIFRGKTQRASKRVVREIEKRLRDGEQGKLELGGKRK